MGFIENIVESTLKIAGVDAEAAEKIGDMANFGANVACGNWLGAASDVLDFADLDDDVPWLCTALDLAGGDPAATEVLGKASALGQGALADLGLGELSEHVTPDNIATFLGIDRQAQATPGEAWGFLADPRTQDFLQDALRRAQQQLAA